MENRLKGRRCRMLVFLIYILRLYFLASTPDVQWIKQSIKHAPKLSEFAKILKTQPSKVTRIGTFSVCLDDNFCIGHGGYGTKVYVGLSDDGYEVAIKRLNLEECQQIGDNEKNILNCPNVRKEKHIINYRFYQPIDSTKACLVLDLHEESLSDYVNCEDRPVEQLLEEGPDIIRQILYGVRSLHCSDPEILHRDLKPSNILINVEGEMVLADFGISRTLPKDQTTYMSGIRGTEDWMAVESLLAEDDEDDADIQVRYKKQSDIQVVGMLCYYILTKGKHPYGKRYDRTGNITRGNFDLKDLSDPCAKDLITWMLQHDPVRRPTVHECLKHPYLRTPEENFKFVACVGNEREIKCKGAVSIVVQELNKLPGLSNWTTMIDACVMAYISKPRRTVYSNNAADLLRFIRNMAAHWRDKARPADVENAVVRTGQYFERKFPTLPIDLHRIIRGHPDWTTRDDLKEFF